jgi:hypothetical protein
MTQHWTTFPPRSSTSSSRLSTRRTSPKASCQLTNHIYFELTWISEILQEITKETSRYIRHSLRSGATALSTKDEQIPQKIDQSYAEVDKLAQEKLQLAERLGGLIQRARTRLDYDLRRVLILQGDDPGQPAFVSTSRNPVQEMNDSLRLAIAETSPIPSPPPVVLSTTQAPTQKSTFHFPSFLPAQRAYGPTQSRREKGHRAGGGLFHQATEPGSRVCPRSSAADAACPAAVTSPPACAWTTGAAGTSWP